jgi:hypothetical protein
MPGGTTLTDLYTAICTVVQNSTSRRTWTKSGIQATPKGPYATVYLEQGEGRAQDVVEMVELATPGPNGETFVEAPWGTTHLICMVEFYRDTTGTTALQDATRFKNSLQLSARFDDLWLVCGMGGAPSVIDFSTVFRADTESRVRVTFSINANLIDLPLTGANIFEIDSPNIEVFDKDTTGVPVATVTENES